MWQTWAHEDAESVKETRKCGKEVLECGASAEKDVNSYYCEPRILEIVLLWSKLLLIWTQEYSPLFFPFRSILQGVLRNDFR